MINEKRELTSVERFAVSKCSTPDDLDELARLIKGEEGLYPSRHDLDRPVKKRTYRHRRPKKMTYTDAQKKKAIELYKQGKSVKAIERQTGVRAGTVYTFVGSMRLRREKKQKPKSAMFNRKYSKEKIEEALDMYRRGDDVKEIAKLVGMNWKTIYSYAHERGIRRGITEKDREHDAKLERKMGITAGRRETKMPRKELKELVEGYWGAAKTWDYKDLVEHFGCTPNAAAVAVNQLKREWSFMQNFNEVKVVLEGNAKRTRFIPKAEKVSPAIED